MSRNKENLRVALTLVIIALIAGAMLGIVNAFTKIDEGEQLRKKIGEGYDSPIAEVISLEDYTNADFGVILAAYRAEDGAVIVLSRSDKAYNSAGLELIVIFKDNLINKIIVYANSETPGVGSKSLSADYLSQFIGLDTTKYDGAAFKPGAGDVKVDAVTGATKTGNGTLIAINNAIKFYKEGR